MTMLRTEAARNPMAWTVMLNPSRAATSPTAAPSEKKSRKKETVRSSPTKARAASAAQKMISHSKSRISCHKCTPQLAQAARNLPAMTHPSGLQYGHVYPDTARTRGVSVTVESDRDLA